MQLKGVFLKKVFSWRILSWKPRNICNLRAPRGHWPVAAQFINNVSWRIYLVYSYLLTKWQLMNIFDVCLSGNLPLISVITPSGVTRSLSESWDWNKYIQFTHDHTTKTTGLTIRGNETHKDLVPRLSVSKRRQNEKRNGNEHGEGSLG